jgi:hypothetical protein
MTELKVFTVKFMQRYEKLIENGQKDRSIEMPFALSFKDNSAKLIKR